MIIMVADHDDHGDCKAGQDGGDGDDRGLWGVELIGDDNLARFDINQGELGDCWLLAATANLTMNKRVGNIFFIGGYDDTDDSDSVDGDINNPIDHNDINLKPKSYLQLRNRVVHLDQSFSEMYAGIFHFQ